MGPRGPRERPWTHSYSKRILKLHSQPFATRAGVCVDPTGVLLSRSWSNSVYPDTLPAHCVSTWCPSRPEKLEIGRAMRLDQVTRQLPAELFSHQLFKGSREGDVSKSLVWICLFDDFFAGFSFPTVPTGTRVLIVKPTLSTVLFCHMCYAV